MIEVQLESGGKGRVFARRRVWWMLAVLLMLPGLVAGQRPKKKPSGTHAAATSKKSPAKKGAAKIPARSRGHAVTSHSSSRSKGHAVVSPHGKRRSSRYIAPAPVIRSRYGAARPVQETAQVPVARDPQQVPATRVPDTQVPATPIPEADAPGVAAQQETAPADESLYADSVLPPASAQPFRYARALDSFFKALAAEQASRKAGVADVSGAGSIVRILQFGDSHTAADIFTGQMRALLQAKFGNGGLGFQYPGHPFAGYRLLGSSRSQTPGWVTQGNRFTDLGDGDTGLGGIAISTRRPGESVFLTTTCETLQVQYLRQPGGGALDFSDNGQPVSEIKTGTEDSTDPANSEPGAGTFTYSCTPGEHEFQLITMDSAPVRLLGLVTEQAGVTYECLGINGAVAPLILKWNQQMFADYLGQRNPNLIVLAYGTNEAAESASRNDEYVAELHEVLQNLHRIVPGASILMLGPYDRALKVGRGRHAAWHTQEAIDRIIADQKEACKVDGCAFYDERARMGGPGTMQRWFSDGLAQGDRTHLTGTGYRVLANALYRDLMTAYNNYLATAGASSPGQASAQ